MPDQDTRIRSRLRIDPNDGLAVEILRRVGNQSVLTHHGDDVLRCEQEAAQVRALHLGVTPLGGNRGADGCQGRGQPVMALLHVLDVAAAAREAATMEVYRGMEQSTLLALALRDAAASLPNIGSLTITPDLLSGALAGLFREPERGAVPAAAVGVAAGAAGVAAGAAGVAAGAAARAGK